MADFWGETAPPFLDTFRVPAAILCRPVGSPNFETIYFCSAARSLDFEPVILEFPDRFVGINAEKRALWKMRFKQDRQSEGGWSFSMFDRQPNEGQPFSSIRMPGGQFALEVHRKLLPRVIETPPIVIDMTRWFTSIRNHQSDYYQRFMAIFVSHGLWCENFLMTDDREMTFVRNIIIPAFMGLQQSLGVQPLICRFLPEEDEAEPGWLHYPSTVAKELKSLLPEAEFVRSPSHSTHLEHNSFPNTSANEPAENPRNRG